MTLIDFRHWVFALCLALPLSVAADRVERIADTLNLTDAQRTEFLDVMKSAKAERKALWEDKESLTKEQRQERMAAIRDKTDAKLATFLSAEQQADLKKHREEKRKHAKKDKKGKGHAKRLAKELDLNEAQQRQFKAIIKERKAERRALKGDWKDMTPEQKRAYREQMRAQFETDLASILTPTQQAKFQTLKAERADKMKEHHGKKHKHGKES